MRPVSLQTGQGEPATLAACMRAWHQATTRIAEELSLARSACPHTRNAFFYSTVALHRNLSAKTPIDLCCRHKHGQHLFFLIFRQKKKDYLGPTEANNMHACRL
jgi:hypothetical protein